MATYAIGDDVVLKATFKDRLGVLTNPTTVACRVADPLGSLTTVAANEISTGVYEGVFAPTVHGQHWYRFEGAGVIRTASEAIFLVAAQQVPAS